MAGRIPARISAYNAEPYSDEASDSDSDDENIGAVNFKRNPNRKFNGKRDPRKDYPDKNKGYNSKKEYYRKNGGPKPQGDVAPSVPPKLDVAVALPATNPPTPVDVATSTAAMLDQFAKKLLAEFDNRRQPRRGRVDKSTKKCYRCQVLGHYAAECTAEKPVLRSSAVSTENEVN